MGATRTYAIIDIETTGGDPRVDRITEIAIYLFDGVNVLDQFVSLVNPQMPIPAFISTMTGIDNEMVRHAPKFFEIARRIVEITRDAIFVAHNVRFDYSFVQKEFRQLGYTFVRRQLCTVKLSRRVMPGLSSYSLRNLCAHLDITNEARHRAWGDATATVALFGHLLQEGAVRDINRMLAQEISQVRLPPHLDPALVDDLPEEPGVYYFHNQLGQVIYVGKSTQIRKRVMSHFQGAHNASKTLHMLDQMYDITYELTGSEIMALLLENAEIKRLQPSFNQAQRRTRFNWGVYTREDRAGYLRFWVGKYDEAYHPLAGYTSQAHAEAALDRRGRMYQLCPQLNGLEKSKGPCFHRQLHICQGACTGEEIPASYNLRAEDAIRDFTYGGRDRGDFLVVSTGRTYEERSVVWVAGGLLRGYGWLDQDIVSQGPDAIRAALPETRELPDVQRIIRGYIKRHPKEVIALTPA